MYLFNTLYISTLYSFDICIFLLSDKGWKKKKMHIKVKIMIDRTPVPANPDNRRRLKYLYDTVATGTPAWKKWP